MNEVPPIVPGASKNRKRFPWIWIAIPIVIFFFAIAAIFLGFIIWHSWPDAKSADAGFNKAKKTINPELLRDWATLEVPKYLQPTNNSFPPQIPAAEIPACLQKLYSEPVEDATVWGIAGYTNIILNKAGSNSVSELGITMQPGHTNGGYVQVCWGGPFFHWMLEVGPTNFTLPPDDQMTIVEWVPGIYYTREDTVHPFR